MRTSHILATLSLTTSLALLTALAPAQAAFEFNSKAAATPAPVTTTPAKPAAIVPVTKTDSAVTASDVAKPAETVPVWTAQKAAPTTPVPLTPVVSSSDSLQMLDGPLLPEDDVAPPAASLPPAVSQPAPTPVVIDKPSVLPPSTGPRRVLAQSSDIETRTTPLAPVTTDKAAARNAALWDKPPAAINPSTDPVLAGMTTQKADIGKPVSLPPAKELPPLVAADEPMDLAPVSDDKPSKAIMTQSDAVKTDSAAILPPPAPMNALAPAAPAPAPIVETVMDPVPSMTPADDAVIQGFGTNLPLAMALRQVVPATYRFSFGDGVNPGQRVSWQGGKNWSQVVSDMTAKNGLTSEISGNVVAIRANGTPSIHNVMDDLVANDKPSILPPPAPLKPLTPPKPLNVDKGVMPAQPLALSDDVAKPAPAPIVNRSIMVDDNTVAKPDAVDTDKPEPLPRDDHGALLPPPVKPLQEKLEATADKQAIVTTKTDDKANSAALTTSQEWMAHSGQSLRTILQDWSKQANVSLVWTSDYDYPLQTDVRIAGTYPDAVRTLLAGFSKAQPKPIGRLHNNAGVGAQPVLIVDTPRLIKD